MVFGKWNEAEINIWWKIKKLSYFKLFQFIFQLVAKATFLILFYY